MMVEEDDGSHLGCVRLRCRNFILTKFLLWELGYPTQVTSDRSILRGEAGKIAFSGIVCVDPLRLGVLKGEKSTPSIGWDVQVGSHRLGSGRWMEGVQDNDYGAFHLDTIRMCIICIE
jgi:hypothetical protein